MKLEDKIKRVSEMETLTKAMEQANQQLSEALEAWLKAREGFDAVQEYYYSKAWQEDIDSSNNGEFPDSLSQGVLSQDWIYDVMGDNDQTVMNLANAAKKYELVTPPTDEEK